MNQLPRRALSRYGLTFQGNILSVNCQCRMLTRVRRTHSTSSVENSLITNPRAKQAENLSALEQDITNLEKAATLSIARMITYPR
ncbi:TPA: hypothetical protein OB663_003616 [Escherichia coli]|nr:hypothetical protein [Escherichia coli]HCO7470096.1 hypothetical protein [Escherichia coli]HCO7479996.1 hypothetical protein [Escherichia coli]HCO7679951.1 hypothetical protein [Escherichia coli]HCO7684077.1 hypothetical protein [Escherichia coli]